MRYTGSKRTANGDLVCLGESAAVTDCSGTYIICDAVKYGYAARAGVLAQRVASSREYSSCR